MTENKNDQNDTTIERQAQNESTTLEPNVPKQDARSPGAQLRDAREAMGMSQEQVAERLHLRLNNVQDIESDTHQQKVSITFTKGYVRIYAKLVGLAVEPLLTAFDELHSEEKTPAKLQSFSQRVAQEANDQRWMMVTYVVIFLVVASVVIWWFQQSEKPFGTRLDEFSSDVVEQVKGLTTNEADSENDSSTEVSQKPNAELRQAPAPVPNDLESNGADIQESALESDVQDAEPDLSSNAGTKIKSDSNQDTANTDSANSYTSNITENTSSSILPDESSVTSASNEASQAIESVVEQSESTVDEALANVESSTYQVNADGTVDLVFTFKDDCWVSVRDVNKETMAYGVKKKGRVMSVSGIPPIRVILGAPQNVEIDFGGVPVDMSVHPAGRSANFKLPVVGE